MNPNEAQNNYTEIMESKEGGMNFEDKVKQILSYFAIIPDEEKEIVEAITTLHEEHMAKKDKEIARLKAEAQENFWQGYDAGMKYAKFVINERIL